MIPFKDFKTIVETLQKASDTSSELYNKYGIDLMNYENNYHTLIELFLSNSFNEVQNHWFSWYVYENDFGRGNLDASMTENGVTTKIAYDLESLYEVLKEYETDKGNN